MKRLVIDLDNTICETFDGRYEESKPCEQIIERIKEYKNLGFDVVIHTSRNVRTYKGNIGKITAFTLPIIIEWLKKHDVPFDEVYVGKPWCGDEGFYVDDRAIRPAEFLDFDLEEIKKLINIKE